MEKILIKLPEGKKSHEKGNKNQFTHYTGIYAEECVTSGFS